MPLLLTRPELAETLRISLDGLDRLIHHEERPIPRYQAGRRMLFDLAEVLRHLRVPSVTETEVCSRA